MRGLLIPNVRVDHAIEHGEVASVRLDASWQLNPRVSLRPERFGALAYHFGNRRLSFLRHPDLVAVANALADADTVADALVVAGVHQGRWPSFLRALDTLAASDMVIPTPPAHSSRGI